LATFSVAAAAATVAKGGGSVSLAFDGAPPIMFGGNVA
jgi:hypothetical protein